jgi:glycosyltransferase involved in cell wall biosynthesis
MLKDRRIEVLHTHQYTPFFYGALAARLSSGGTRVVFTEHGRHWPDIVGWKRRWFNRVVLDRLADRITGVCAFSADALSERDGFRRARIQVIENGIDLARYDRHVDRGALKLRLRLNPNRRYIASVARFHPVKDHGTLIRAFAGVCAKVDDTDLLLVGDGQLRPDLEGLVRSLGIEQRVLFCGVRDDVPDLLAAADVFALSSLSEAASITLLEAMASGAPVVVTEVGGNPEIVRQGIDGFMTPRGDHGAMAAAILRLLADPVRAAQMGRNGAERVHLVYRLDRTIARYYDLYRELAGERAEN